MTHVQLIGEKLNDETLPLKDRFRALFTLRNLGGCDSIDNIAMCFKDSSVLLKHELAFCLGQMQDKYAVPLLTQILKDEKQDVITRHEAGEALGAIGCIESLEVLQQLRDHPLQEIAETCELAISRINWLHGPVSCEPVSQNPYQSVDPAVPSSETSVQQLLTDLLDEKLALYDRYRCMFALRNIGTDECITALAEGLRCKASALFRHEIAYVLGQTQRPTCVPQLVSRLRDDREHPMVRHECAEALGAMATDESTRVLGEYVHDSERVVRESCVVALDISEYETTTQFQYADGLVQAAPS